MINFLMYYAIPQYMSDSNLYKKYAKYYDKIYSEKDYESEAEFIKWAVQKHKTSTGNKLLDVACGTGNHMQFLKDQFSIVGVDINPEMLKIAKKKVAKVKFIKGDMKNLMLDKNNKFDVIICMFAAIAYNLNYKELKSTLKSFNTYLKPGGVLIFDLHIHEDYWLGDRVWVDTVVEKELKLARISISPKRKNVLDLNLILFVNDKGKIDFDIDHHQLGLFNPGKIKKVMKDTGFDPRIYAGFTKKPWNNKMKSPVVFIGIK